MRKTVFVAALLPVVLFSGCAQKNEFAPPPPPEVGVVHPTQKDIVIYRGFPGRLEALETIKIHARVKGFLRTIDFKDGQNVKKGDLLFTIEDEEYKADVAAAEAALAKAKATLKLEESTLKRNQEAFKTKAVSELDVLSAEARYAGAEGSVMEAKANLDNARLLLSYTKVYAPMDGRMSRHLYGIGDLVGAADSSVLNTLVVEKPIYAYFSIDERAILPYLKKNGRKNDLTAQVPSVKIELADGTIFGEEGRINYVDPAFDPETGTARARAVFENTENQLVPGLYAKVLIPHKLDGAILVPKIALGRDMRGAYLLVVNKENKVETRYVEEGSETGEYRVIEKGISPKDRVVVDGIQRARPGIEVRVVDASTPAATK